MQIHTRLERIGLPSLLVLWMLFGGALFWRAWVTPVFIASLAGIALWAGRAWLRGCRPALLKPALLFGMAGLVSLAANLDIFSYSAGWLLVFVFGILALVVGADLGSERLLTALYWAGWIWLVVWPLPRILGWMDNRNLLGVWPALSVLVILARRKSFAWTLPHLAVLLFLGSRGALLGLCVALVVYYRPPLTRAQAILSGVLGVAFLYSLFALRPQEALNRFSYIHQAFQALAAHNPWFGLGPGGIGARHAIGEPGSQPGQPEYYHLHAHNLFLQILTEFGLVGLAALALAAVWVRESRLNGRWQLAILSALLVHSLVDLPIYFPGPLLVFMAVAGSASRPVQVRAPAARRLQWRVEGYVTVRTPLCLAKPARIQASAHRETSRKTRLSTH